jgi:hypothetical protein
MRENGRGSGAGKSRRQLNPRIAEWLAAMDGDEADGEETAGGPDWDAWLAGLKAAGRIVKVDGILVDRAVLEQRFRCVPERCSPGAERGRSRCCCADLEVHLEALERLKIEHHCAALSRYLAPREPRLGLRGKGHLGCFWREEGLDLLSRPGGRCVFSRRDPKGRLRCHLHAFARSEGIDRNAVQPFTCRIFPLLLIDLGRNRLVLSVLARHNYKEFASLPPQRFPCLSDRSLPPIYESLGGDLDWIFGEGFAAALAGLARTPAGPRPR